MENNKLTIKERLAYFTCVIAFILGWLLVIIGFFLPPQGEVSSSVLWILGQSLLYCSAILGISQYYNTELTKFKREMKKEIQNQ